MGARPVNEARSTTRAHGLSDAEAVEVKHTFTITSPAINEQLRTSSPPTNVTVTMPQSGDLAFFCRLHAHVGMWGVFFSGPAPAATPSPF
jgi:plastocyanin